ALNKAGLAGKLGVEELWYQIKGDDRIILAYKKKFGPVDEQLVIRLIENGASEESEVYLTDRDLKELISKSKEKNTFTKKHRGNLPLLDDHVKQSGFVAGALMLDLEQRFNFDCFINEPTLLDKKILLNLVSKSNTLDGWKTNIPVVIECSNNHQWERFQFHIKNGGLEMHPSLQNDRRLAAYILFDIYNDEVYSDHLPIKPYEGIIKKIMDHNDRWTQDGGVDHDLLARDLKREIDYASNEINLKENPSLLHTLILGQVIGLDNEQVDDRFRFNYLSDSLDGGDREILKQSVKSYIMSTQDGDRLINVNLIDTSLPQAKKIIPFFTGNHFMMFPTGDRSQYLMINVNLLQDQYGKVKVIIKHQKIDTKPYEEQYSLLNSEKSVPENEGFMLFSANQNSMFRGYMENIMQPYTSSLDYSLYRLISSGSESELHAFIHGLLANHGKFINTKKELIALMKGAIMNKAQLIHPPIENQHALIVKKVSQEEIDEDLEYELDDSYSPSDIAEPVILIGANFKQSHQSADQCVENIEREFRASIFQNLDMAFDDHSIAMAAVINKHTEIIDEMVTVRSVETDQDSMDIDNFDDNFDQCFGTRRKRNAACEISEKFKLKIDGQLNKEKFIEYIEQERNPQRALNMIKFFNDNVEKTGLITNSNLKSKLQKFTSDSTMVRKLSKVGRMGHFVTRTFMLKNIGADIIHKNWKGLALNAGFLAGGHLSFVAAEQTEKYALKLMTKNKLLTGKILKAASPFVARLTGIYNIYDLYQNIKAYRSGSEDAVVGIVNDATFLAVDVAEVGAVLADGLGLAAIAGPVGTVIAAMVFVGTDIYTSVKAVNKVDETIHLSASEKITEGLRSFLGFGIDDYFVEMKDEKLVNERLVSQKIDLMTKSDLDVYVFSIEQGYADEKFEDNNILLTGNDKVCWNRARPENVPKNLTLMCFTHTPMEFKKADMTLTYITPFAIPLLPIAAPVDSNLDCQMRVKCQNAIGIVKKDIKSKICKSLIQMGNGVDRVEGSPRCHNTFIIGNGDKYVNGGEHGNTFILNSNSTTGKINGRGVSNIIDLGDFAQNFMGSLDVHIESTFPIKSTDKLYINNVFDIIGRRGRADRIRCHCRTSFVDGNGALVAPRDFIILPKSAQCFYNMTISLSSHVKVISKAQRGELKFVVNNNEPGKMRVEFTKFSHTKNIFLLNFKKSELKRIRKTKGEIILFSTKCTLTILGMKLRQSEFRFIDDGSTLRIDHHGQHSLFVRSKETDVNYLIDHYGNLAENLGIFITIFLEMINETIFIGHGHRAMLSQNNHHAVNIIPNDPDHVSHLYAGKTSAIFQINFRQTSKVVIHSSREEINYVKTVDLKQLSQSLPVLHTLGIELFPDNLDIHLRVLDKSPNDTRNIGVVILKNALPWYQDFHIIRDQAPLTIKVGRTFSLVPVPLIIPADVDKVLINPKDVELGTEIIIKKNVKKFSFFKYKKALIATNHELSQTSIDEE
uniref:Apolipoprotein B n=1 Tax=Romanomermis culicivorax TaxID=13658 RepID=A0A915HXE7_ROMCU